MGITPFKQVDVFTSVRFKGNPVAVVLKADGMTTQQMQQIANWTNSSEATFVLTATDPGADYRVRIFSPTAELPFAGHPTIGTAHALLEAGIVRVNGGILVQECGAGLVRLTVKREEDGQQWISCDLPEPSITPLEAAAVDELQCLLGNPLHPEHAPRLIDVGPRWIVVQLPSAASVRSTQPDFQRVKEQNAQADATGIVIFGEHEVGSPTRIEVRAFAPAHGVNEDPVCGNGNGNGNGNGSVAAFIHRTGQATRFGSKYLASQGANVGRARLIRLNMGDQRIQVGGAAVTCIDGQLPI